MPLHSSVMHRLFLALLLCVGLSAPTAFADDGGGDSLPSIFDWFEQKGISGTAAQEWQTPHEVINHFTGKLHYSVTDIVIPGNGGMDLKIQRSYNNVEDPYLSTASWGGYEYSPLGFGWTLHMGRILRATGIAPCAPSTAEANLVLELPDGSRQLLYKDTYQPAEILLTEGGFFKKSPDSTT